ncbi:MAG: hypothetical protein IJU79_00965 [Desulfovibrionaceae bacterium]|nr:hypothetical protein [Desulfovibrionaceae bacterium]
MGKQSCLGPFDPQVNGFSAIRVIEEFNNAIESIKKDPDVISLWQMIIAKYYPTFLDSCKFASERAAIMVKTWLTDNMFSDVSNPNNEAEKFIQEIQKIGMKDDHDKHISANHCKSLGLKIAMLEDDQKLQELVLTIHHAYMLTFHSCTLVKIIENHNVITGKVYFYLRLSDFIF